MAGFWNRLRPSHGSGSRKAAKERLQLVLITDRSDISPDKLQAMRDEIIAVISKYTPVDMGRIEIKIEQRHRDNFLGHAIAIRRAWCGKTRAVDSAAACCSSGRYDCCGSKHFTQNRRLGKCCHRSEIAARPRRNSRIRPGLSRQRDASRAPPRHHDGLLADHPDGDLSGGGVAAAPCGVIEIGS